MRVSRSPRPENFGLSFTHSKLCTESSSYILVPKPQPRIPARLHPSVTSALPFPGGSYRWRQRLTMYSKKGKVSRKIQT